MERIHETLHQAEHHLERLHAQPKRIATGRADYGQDVPVFTMLFFIAGAVFSAIAAAIFGSQKSDHPRLAAGLSAVPGLLGLLGLSGGSALVWASRSGKYQMRDRLMALQNWRGDEQVLDVGCGAGLLLIGAAKRLTTGKAVGVDIWDTNLEYGSSPESVWANARIEGVTDRVEVKDGNACDLPFADGAFDIVFTSNMLHHLSKEERDQAIREMVRVLIPGGRLVIAEVAFFGQYREIFQRLGVSKVEQTPLNMPLWKSITAVK